MPQGPCEGPDEYEYIALTAVRGASTVDQGGAGSRRGKQEIGMRLQGFARYCCATAVAFALGWVPVAVAGAEKQSLTHSEIASR